MGSIQGMNGSYPQNGVHGPFLVSPSNRVQFESVNSFSASPASALAQSPVSFNSGPFNEEMIVNMAQNVNNMLNHVTLGGPEILPPPPQPPQMEDIDLEYASEVEGDVDEHAVFNRSTAGSGDLDSVLPVSVSMATTVSGISMDEIRHYMDTPQEPP